MAVAAFMCWSYQSGCFVEDINIPALACGKQGECAAGRRCYQIPDYGAFCLANGDGLPLYEPVVAVEPKAEDPIAELPPPDASEPQPEPVPEPTPEPGPEPQPEPQPEPVPEPTPEPTQEAEPVDITADAGTEPTPDTVTQDD